ncbi:hypothetical protein NM208_g8074 [Fusarium decemcellulare]|nr:hypothetical protein NM208_g8074 [Fusarium decemcellulare]
MASYEVPDWAQSRSDDGAAEGDFTESEEESEVEILECVVCNKSFKSEKQLEAHERSKKHVKAVQQLRRQLKREGAELDLDDDKPSPPPDVDQDGGQSPVSEKDVDAGDSDDAQAKMKTPPSKGDTAEPNPIDSAEVSDNGDYAPRDVVEERLTSSGKAKSKQEDTSEPDDELSTATKDLSVDEPAQGKKIGKAKAKRAKKAAAAQSQQDDGQKCGVCGETFSSRTKLFTHIRDEGHAALKPTTGGGKKKKR